MTDATTDGSGTATEGQPPDGDAATTLAGGMQAPEAEAEAAEAQAPAGEDAPTGDGNADGEQPAASAAPAASSDGTAEDSPAQSPAQEADAQEVPAQGANAEALPAGDGGGDAEAAGDGAQAAAAADAGPPGDASTQDAAAETPGKTSDELPSIIVEPEARQPSDPPQMVVPEFNPDAADQFASSYRASWEPAEPKAEASPAAAVSVPAAVPETQDDDALFASMPGEVQRKRNIRLTIGAVGGVVAFIIAGVMASSTDEPEEAASAPEQAPKEAAPSEPAQAPPAPQEAAAPPSEPAPPADFQVQVTTTPADAALTLDGTPVANPYDARLAAGGSHVFAATAAGFTATEQTVAVDADRMLTLTLTPEPPPPVVAAPPVVKKKARRRVTRPKAKRPVRRKVASKPKSAPVRAAPRPVVKVKPKLSIKPRKKKKRAAGFVTSSPY